MKAVELMANPSLQESAFFLYVECNVWVYYER